MITKTAQNNWLRKNDQSFCGKGLKVQKGKESMKALKSQEEEKCMFPDGKYTRERTKKEILLVALKKNFDKYPILKFT